ncbi:MAG: FHA domain-containing protein [Planctomycetota bacterium]
MSPRYVLRFETGERQGEIVPLNVAPGAPFSVGRKPGNSLQVAEASVSGRHAEFTLIDGGVQLRDLDSTNGTKVGGERVRNATLRHGDEFALGSVSFVLIDEEAAAPVSAPALPSLESRARSLPRGDAPPMADPGAGPTRRSGALPAPAQGDLGRTQVQPREETLEITAADLARSRSGSKVGLVAIGALAAVGAGLWFWLGREGQGGGNAPARPVTSPSGNLLSAGYSFEGDAGWTSDEGAPSVFRTSRSARASGEVGLVVDLGGDGGDQDQAGAAGDAPAGPDYALHASDEVRVRAGAQLEAQVSVRTTGAGRARIGLRFAGEGESAPQPMELWSDPIESANGHELFALASAVPPGCDRVTLLLLAELKDGAGAEGEVEVDDASLVPTGSASEPPRIGVWEVAGLGTPARSFALAKIDRVFVSGVRFHTATDGAGRVDAPRAMRALAYQLGANGLEHRVEAPGTLALVVEPSAASRGVASLGEGGYIAHGGNFERERVTDLLLGSDMDLVRVVFSRPVDVRGVADGDAVRVRVALGAGDSVRWQLGFEEERIVAQRIAREARAARSAGRPGEALAMWDSLLAEHPFEQTLVDEAATVRGEVVREGMNELRELGRELERARFFRLVDLYDELAERARANAARFQGSEVEAEAKALLATLSAERNLLARELDSYERQRLEAIAAFLVASESPNLAREVQSYLAEMLDNAAADAAGNGGGR